MFPENRDTDEFPSVKVVTQDMLDLALSKIQTKIDELEAAIKVLQLAVRD